MRYTYALIAAATLIAIAFLYVHLTNRWMENQIRDVFRQQKRDGTLPTELQGIDIETAERLPDVGIKLTRWQMFRMQLSFWFADYWWIWAPFVTASCIGIAALMNRLRGTA